jgi:ElaB/YqjD/DUF883 family membrane-anchored ribosome-binding protein
MPDVTEDEIEELEAEVERKRDQLEQKRLEERHTQAKRELREIRRDADRRIQAIEDAEEQAEREAAVERGEAYFCDECEQFVEYETTRVENHRKDKDWCDHGLCKACFREQRQERHAEELADILGETLTVTEFSIDRHETDKIRGKYGGIGALHLDMTVETEDGRRLNLRHRVNDHYYRIKDPDSDDKNS